MNHEREISDSGEATGKITSAATLAIKEALEDALADYSLAPRGHIEIKFADLNEGGLKLLAVHEATNETVAEGRLDFLIDDLAEGVRDEPEELSDYARMLVKHLRHMADFLEGSIPLEV